MKLLLLLGFSLICGLQNGNAANIQSWDQLYHDASLEHPYVRPSEYVNIPYTTFEDFKECNESNIKIKVARRTYNITNVIFVTHSLLLTSDTVIPSSTGSISVCFSVPPIEAVHMTRATFSTSKHTNLNYTILQTAYPSKWIAHRSSLDNPSVFPPVTETKPSIFLVEVPHKTDAPLNNFLHVFYILGRALIPINQSLQRSHITILWCPILKFFDYGYPTENGITKIFLVDPYKSLSASQDPLLEFKKDNVHYELPFYHQDEKNYDVYDLFLNLETSNIYVVNATIALDISHWTQSTVDGYLDVFNDSPIPPMMIMPKLDTSFNRSHEIIKSTHNALDGLFPIGSQLLSLYDNTGNVTTALDEFESNSKKKSKNLLSSRYHVLGGWRSDLNFSYSIPAEYLIAENAEQGVRLISFSPPVPLLHTYIETVYVNISLPFGADDIDIESNIKFDKVTIDSKRELLDIFWYRPVISFQKKGFIISEIDSIVVSYKFKSFYDYIKILLLWCVFSILFVIIFNQLGLRKKNRLIQDKRLTEYIQQIKKLINHMDYCKDMKKSNNEITKLQKEFNKFVSNTSQMQLALSPSTLEEIMSLVNHMMNAITQSLDEYKYSELRNTLYSYLLTMDSEF